MGQSTVLLGVARLGFAQRDGAARHGSARLRWLHHTVQAAPQPTGYALARTSPGGALAAQRPAAIVARQKRAPRDRHRIDWREEKVGIYGGGTRFHGRGCRATGGTCSARGSVGGVVGNAMERNKLICLPRAASRINGRGTFSSCGCRYVLRHLKAHPTLPRLAMRRLRRPAIR